MDLINLFYKVILNKKLGIKYILKLLYSKQPATFSLNDKKTGCPLLSLSIYSASYWKSYKYNKARKKKYWLETMKQKFNIIV